MLPPTSVEDSASSVIFLGSSSKLDPGYSWQPSHPLHRLSGALTPFLHRICSFSGSGSFSIKCNNSNSNNKDNDHDYKEVSRIVITVAHS